MTGSIENRRHFCLAAVAIAALAFGPAAHARKSPLEKAVESAVESALEPGSTTVAGTGQVEFAFSPREGAEGLVIKAIRSSRHDIRMLAYALTSAPIVEALIAAHKRGVDIAVVADYKENIKADRSGKAHAALSALVTSGIAVRTIDVYAIHHDKTLVIDGATVQTGSFNYTQAAAKSNSENVIVLWNNPQLARGYLAHWERNWKQGRAFEPAY
ncbi:phospholipase D family protein [Ramlibacter agri]|uniref:phospholipase D family nuclease n=1 Tax=Ramlibacter agri TaxID=2728837 RepID=UPI001F106F7B|nr:phospholipase D family protein [Ramlibacter agri]